MRGFLGSVEINLEARRDGFADSLTSLCVSAGQEGPGSQGDKKKTKSVRTGGVKLWEADGENMSVCTHIKVTHS